MTHNHGNGGNCCGSGEDPGQLPGIEKVTRKGRRLGTLRLWAMRSVGMCMISVFFSFLGFIAVMLYSEIVERPTLFTSVNMVAYQGDVYFESDYDIVQDSDEAYQVGLVRYINTSKQVVTLFYIVPFHVQFAYAWLPSDKGTKGAKLWVDINCDGTFETKVVADFRVVPDCAKKARKLKQERAHRALGRNQMP